jgi:hypothetical protein
VDDVDVDGVPNTPDEFTFNKTDPPEFCHCVKSAVCAVKPLITTAKFVAPELFNPTVVPDKSILATDPPIAAI